MLHVNARWNSAWVDDSCELRIVLPEYSPWMRRIMLLKLSVRHIYFTYADRQLDPE